MAERETGESREEEGLLPSFPSPFARFARFPRSRFPRLRDHPKGLLLRDCSQSTEEVKIRLRALLVVRNKAAKSHKKLAARDEGQL